MYLVEHKTLPILVSSQRVFANRHSFNCISVWHYQ